MSKTYRPWNPNHQYLLPLSVQDWLPEKNLVYLLLKGSKGYVDWTLDE